MIVQIYKTTTGNELTVLQPPLPQILAAIKVALLSRNVTVQSYLESNEDEKAETLKGMIWGSIHYWAQTGFISIPEEQLKELKRKLRTILKRDDMVQLWRKIKDDKDLLLSNMINLSLPNYERDIFPLWVLIMRNAGLEFDNDDFFSKTFNDLAKTMEVANDSNTN